MTPSTRDKLPADSAWVFSHAAFSRDGQAHILSPEELQTTEGRKKRDFAVRATHNCTLGGQIPLPDWSESPQSIGNSPYTLHYVTWNCKDGNPPAPDAAVLNSEQLALPSKQRATVAFGDSRHRLNAGICPLTGQLFQDYVQGGNYRSRERFAQQKITASAMDTPSLSGARIYRNYYDPVTHKPLGSQILNDATRPFGHLELWPVRTVYAKDGSYKVLVWGDNYGVEPPEHIRTHGRNRHAVAHFTPDNRKTHMIKYDPVTGKVKDTQFFSGPAGSEMLRLAVFPEPNREGHVRQWYKGDPGKTYLHKALRADGALVFYRGTTPQRVPIDRIWYPDGRMEHYRGACNEEKLTSTTFQARSSTQARPAELPLQAPLSVRLGNCPFNLGALVVPQNLTRTDLNGRRGTVCGWDETSQRCHVQFSNMATVRILAAKLVDAATYAAERATRRDAKLAERLERLELRGVERACRVAEAVPYEPELVVTRPTEKKKSPRQMAACPISDLPMVDAVLAADGFVYSRKHLEEYWQNNDLKSPITQQPIAAFLLEHLLLQSLAKEIEATPGNPKWFEVPTEVPDVLCCPITLTLMKEPVRASDGNVYEESALREWLSTNTTTTSPLFGTEMNTDFRRDATLKAACAAWR